MSDISHEIRHNAQRNHSAILRGLADVSQRRVAELVGVSESVLSEFKSTHLERCAAVIAACGLRVVPCTDQSYDSSYIDALKTLAAIGLAHDSLRSDNAA